MKVTFFETDYFGSLTKARLAELDNDMLCLTVESPKIDVLNSDAAPIYGLGLSDAIARNREAGRLTFSTVLAQGASTPPDEQDYADSVHLLAAGRIVGQHMDTFTVIVDKSTTSVDTAGKVRDVVEKELAAPGADVCGAMIWIPEFLTEGAAVEDCIQVDRILIAYEGHVPRTRAKSPVLQLYAPFNRDHHCALRMDVCFPKFTKCEGSAMLATSNHACTPPGIATRRPDPSRATGERYSGISHWRACQWASDSRRQ